MSPSRFGFVGLGNMGAPMAANVARAGFDLTVYDAAGSEARAPAGAHAAASLAEVAAAAETVFLSLPDGAASLAVVREIAGLGSRVAGVVVDLSTVGVAAAREAHAVLAEAGLAYVDAPVSGGRAGARAATIAVMWAGPAALLEGHRDVLGAMAGNVFHVGDDPGQGQAMKLLNNFLSATALAATSEAMAFGLSQGLSLATMLAVVNVSTGRNTATSDKFPNRIVTGTYDAGFATALLAKDLGLYVERARAAGAPATIGESVAGLWRAAAEAMPASDITRIYDLVRGGAATGAGPSS